MAYVDGFLLAVPKRKLETYRSLARKAGRVWREHGALGYRECVGDDLKMAKVFERGVKLKRGDMKRMGYAGFKTLVEA